MGINPQWLDALIAHESRWNPLAVSSSPYNAKAVREKGEAPRYAKGLIQFIDSTAQGMGFRDSLDLINKYPSVETQLEGPVFDYLFPMRPFPTEQSLYLAVFYPKARTWDLSRSFPDSVKIANPGINTVADYVNRVRSSIGLPIVAGGLSLGLIAILVGVLFAFMRGRI